MQLKYRVARWALVAAVISIPAAASGKWYNHPSGVSFKYPGGWQPVPRGTMLQLLPPGLKPGQVQNEAYMMGSDSVAGQGITKISDPRVAPYLVQQMASVSPNMTQQGRPRYFAMRKGGGVLGGLGVELRFKGTSAAGQPVRASAFACIIGGNGVVLLAVAPPARYSRRAATMRRIFASLGYRKGAGGGAVGKPARGVARYFVGTWVTMTRNTQNMYALYPNGTFSRRYSSSYGGKFHNQYGGQTGSWGTAGDTHGRGRWSVVGTRRRGTLILQEPNGSRSSVPYQVHVSKGQTYWREYYFGRTLYMRSK